MDTYSLYAESGPQKRKTLIHVGELPGCVANGATTAEAVAAAPDAIRAFLRFLSRHGERVDPGQPFDVRLADHFTGRGFFGQGDPSVTLPQDLQPIDDQETRALLARFAWLREELASWAEQQTDEALDAVPEQGRASRRVLIHVLAGAGGYLSAHLGGAVGFSRLQTQATRGLLPIPEAFRRTISMAEERVWAATPEQRAAIFERSGTKRSLRKALRRMLEHDWEHFAELGRRPGGPPL